MKNNSWGLPKKRVKSRRVRIYYNNKSRALGRGMADVMNTGHTAAGSSLGTQEASGRPT